jgi:CheY-like chemotaxis protein
MLRDRAQPLRGCRVLVVEDEFFLALDLESELRARGADVVGLIGDLPQAKRCVEQLTFDVAVININLRGEDAYPVADELARRQIPFVFATGYIASAIPTRFQDVSHWEKPFAMQEFSKDIARLFKLSRISEVPMARDEQIRYGAVDG